MTKTFRVHLDITTGPPVVVISGDRWNVDGNGHLHIYHGEPSMKYGLLPIASFAAGLWVWIRDETPEPLSENMLRAKEYLSGERGDGK